MKSILKKLKQSCLYADLDEERFKQIYPLVEEQIFLENKTNLITFSLVATILFGIIFLVSFFVKTLTSFRLLYGIMLAICLVTWIINKFEFYRHAWWVRVSCYLFVFSIFLFGILLGAVLTPQELSTAFVALLIAAPLIFLDRPVPFLALILAAYILFMIAASRYEEGSYRIVDCANVTIFTAFAMIACVYTMNLKLKKIFLEHTLRVTGETDALTGLHNRMCFEQDLHGFDEAALSEAYCLFLDVNGLHELNNSQGHAAGDRMLQTVAKEFSARRWEHCYRIGGDEYVALGTNLTTDEMRREVAELMAGIANAGYDVSIGYAFGHEADSMQELIKCAEQKMYEMKAIFYQKRLSPEQRKLRR